MSLDAKTLAFLTAKDQYLEAEWFDDQAYTYLSDSPKGFELLKNSEGTLSALADGIGSNLAYAGGFYIPGPHIHYLSREGKLVDLQGRRSLELPGPSTDLFKTREEIFFVSELGSLNVLYELEGQSFKAHFETTQYLRQVSCHPLQKFFIALTWAKGELPWLSADLIMIRDGGASERLHPPGLDSPCSEAEFSPNGDYVVASFLTDEFHQLWLYKLGTQNWVQLTFAEKEHSTPLRRSSRRTFCFINENLIAFTTCDKGFWRIDTLDYSGHTQKIANPYTYIQRPRVHPRTGKILAFGASLDRPYGPIQLEAGGSSILSEGGSTLGSNSLRAERISWASLNGDTIHGILYRDASRSNPLPLIMPIHGGPCDSVHATWPSKAMAFVKLGYAVFYVNYRGSYGYGISYLQKLEGGLGQIEINDLVTGVKSLAQTGRIDPRRVGLWGGGTASFTVLRALISNPETFAAGVAVFPILNLSDHLSKASEPERTELLWALGADRGDRLEQLSPIRSVDSISRPLGLFSGADDRLSNRRELEDFSAALNARKVPCWLTIYENEGRVFRDPATYSDYYSKVSSFFDRFLKFRSEP